MNRKHLALAATMTLALTGCAATNSPTAPTRAEQPSGAPGAFPVTIATKFGDVTVDKKPTRVVALGWGDAEHALELGVQPVGASDWLNFGGDGVGPWLRGKYSAPPTIIGTLEPSYEKIAALQPDLILDVKSSGDQERHDKLAQIAPVLGVPEGGDAYLTEPNKQLEMIATALGEKERGQALTESVKKKFDKAAQEHPGWTGKTATAVSKTSEGWGAYVKGGDRLNFLSRLGFIQNPKVEALPVGSTGFSTKLSPENLSAIDADLIIGFPIGLSAPDMKNDPVFRRVPAVRAGRALVLEGDTAKAFSMGSPAAQNYAVDKAIPLIESALP